MSPAPHLSLLAVCPGSDRAGPLLDALRVDGFSIEIVRLGAQACERRRLAVHSVLLADDEVSDISLVQLVQRVREVSPIPIVVTTAGFSENDVVALLESGADQCIAKPVRLREFVARIRAAARRAPEPAASRPEPLEIDDVRLDPSEFVLTVSGQEVPITPKEFALLHLLMVNAGQTLPRRLIIDRVWAADAANPKTLDTHIRRLRAKVEANPSAPKRILTVRKVGYRYHRGQGG
jgi:two-component system, OmpR family, response regulator RegX3